MTGEPAEWVAGHTDVRLRPVEESDLDLLARVEVEPELSEPFQWSGFRDPKVHRRRWEQDTYLGSEDGRLVVALPDGTFAGFMAWRLLSHRGPRIAYNIGILLYPEHRGKGLGSAAQCLMADHLFSTTLAGRVEAITGTDNVAEQRALEKAGFQKEGVLRGLGYNRGHYGDGVMYSRIRSDPHP